MIQRIQSIWLFLAACCFLAQWYPSLELLRTRTSGQGIFEDQIFYSAESYALLIGSGVTGILALIAIFLYEERVMQILITFLSSLIQMILGVGLPFYLLNKANKIGQFEPAIGLWLIAAGLVFCWLATRAIRKDDMLVKSMDRLR